MTTGSTLPIVIVGTSPRAFALAAALTEAGWDVAVLARQTPPRAPLQGHGDQAPAESFVVAEIDTHAALDRFLAEMATSRDSRTDDKPPAWITYLGASAPDGLADASYAAGALAVLPPASEVDVACATISRLADRLGRAPDATHAPLPDAPKPLLQRHRTGSNIALRVDRVLLVRHGVVAQQAWHEDGTEGLLGLWGPGQAILGHPDDGCGLTLRAHTDLEIEIVDWSAIGGRADIVESLRQRTLRLESWASMQSRPNVEQRLVGILHWLAEQFGRTVPGGTLIEIRVTHAQLAAAIGATRATVTRILGTLRRRRTITTKSTAQGERLMLGGGATLVHPLRISIGVGLG